MAHNKRKPLFILLFVLTSDSSFSQFGPAWDSIKKVTEEDHQYMMVNGEEKNAAETRQFLVCTISSI